MPDHTPHSALTDDTTTAVGPATAPVAVGPPGYALLAEIGRGGMGVVYRAHDARLNRDIAVKLLQDKYDTASFADEWEKEDKARREESDRKLDEQWKRLTTPN